MRHSGKKFDIFRREIDPSTPITVRVHRPGQGLGAPLQQGQPVLSVGSLVELKNEGAETPNVRCVRHWIPQASMKLARLLRPSATLKSDYRFAASFDDREPQTSMSAAATNRWSGSLASGGIAPNLFRAEGTRQRLLQMPYLRVNRRLPNTPASRSPVTAFPATNSRSFASGRARRFYTNDAAITPEPPDAPRPSPP